jgi:hypothetical protein
MGLARPDIVGIVYILVARDDRRINNQMLLSVCTEEKIRQYLFTNSEEASNEVNAVTWKSCPIKFCQPPPLLQRASRSFSRLEQTPRLSFISDDHFRLPGLHFYGPCYGTEVWNFTSILLRDTNSQLKAMDRSRSRPRAWKDAPK